MASSLQTDRAHSSSMTDAGTLAPTLPTSRPSRRGAALLVAPQSPRRDCGRNGRSVHQDPEAASGHSRGSRVDAAERPARLRDDVPCPTALSERPGLDAVQPIACFPEHLALVSAEAEGRTLSALWARCAAWMAEPTRRCGDCPSTCTVSEPG